MITFGNEPFVESPLTDAMKSATKTVTGLDIDGIKDEIDHQKQEWDQGKKLNSKLEPETDKDGNEIPVEEPNGYGKAMAYTNISVNKGSEGINKKMDEILTGMAPHRYGTRSIIARSRNSVLQFPVYITNTIRVNEAHIIAKMFERVYTTYVQTALNANPVVSEDEVNDLLFLKQFHTNLKESGDLLFNAYYEPIDDIDQMMTEAVFYQEKLSDTMDVVFRWIPCSDTTLINENTRLLNDPLSGLDYLQEAKEDKVQLNSTDKKTEIHKELINEAEFKTMARQQLPAADRNDSSKVDAKIDEIKKMMREDYENAGKQGYKKHFTTGKFVYDGKQYYQIKDKITQTNSGQEVLKQKEKPEEPLSVPRLHDTDVKKINGMLPYTIEASFRVKPKEGASYVVRYLIGVKTVLHLIRPQDLAEDLEGLITGDIKSLRKVKYKTGEIKFNEYLFDIKNIKKNAAKRIDSNKKWINSLNRLAEFDKLNGSLLKKPAELLNGEIPIPNSTIVLSQTDVAMLLNETGIDLGQLSNARRLAKALFSISLAIIDPSAGTMKVMFTDMGSDWDIQSIAAIDAEVSKTDNSAILKELNKIINR